MNGRRIVVTGGAGFIGGHLCRALLGRGFDVVAVDDLSSGRPSNVPAGVELVVRDVSRHELTDLGPVVAVAHLASPASPADYLARPLDTLRTGSEGTRHAAELAMAHGARFVLASTSEVYGDPLVHPQPETYWGNVNPLGHRAVYDEAKRFAEAYTMAMLRTKHLRAGIVRIFNTYGPGLRPGDGRVVSTFTAQALRNEPLTVFGDGAQTRSLCYIDDNVDALVAMLASEHIGPINIGNPDERSVLDLAKLVITLVGSNSGIEHLALPVDDPTRRCPDIGRAREILGWRPSISLEEGLLRTISWFRASELY